jgi:proline dehydrogenase
MFPARNVLRTPVRTFRFSFSSSTHRHSPKAKAKAIASGAAISLGLLALTLPTIYADDSALLKRKHFYRGTSRDPSTSLATLVRTYAVYTLCSVPLLVDNSPEIFSVLRSIPGASHILDALVRATFFAQVRVFHK